MATTEGAQIASPAYLRTLPGPVKQLCIHGEQALKPQKVNGNWRGARISAQKAAHVWKEAILSGTYRSFDPLIGQGWDPSWEKLRSIPRIRAPKLDKCEHTREAQVQKIENMLETMDEKIAEHRKVIVNLKVVFSMFLTKCSKRWTSKLDHNINYF